MEVVEIVVSGGRKMEAGHQINKPLKECALLPENTYQHEQRKNIFTHLRLDKVFNGIFALEKHNTHTFTPYSAT